MARTPANKSAAKTATTKGMALYEVPVNGLIHTFQMDSEDAERAVKAHGAKRVSGAGPVRVAEPTVTGDGGGEPSGTSNPDTSGTSPSENL